MRRTLPSRRATRRHLIVHRAGLHRAHGAFDPQVCMSDLILAILGIVLLGGLAMTAGFALTAGPTAP